MAAAELRAALAALLQSGGFARPSASVVDANQLLEACSRLLSFADALKGTTVAAPERRALTESFTALCAQLDSLDRQLQGVLGRSSAGPVWGAACLQLSAGRTVVLALCSAASACRFDAQTVAKCSRATMLQLGSGRRRIEHELSAARSPGSDPVVKAAIRHSLADDLAAMLSIIQLQQKHNAAFEAFTSTIAPPKALLPWVDAATRLLLAAAPPSLPDGERSGLLAAHSMIAGEVLTDAPFFGHQVALSKDTQLQDALIQQLLSSIQHGLRCATASGTVGASAPGTAGSPASLHWYQLSYAMHALSATSLKPRLSQLAKQAAAAASRSGRGACSSHRTQPNAWPPLTLAAQAVQEVPLACPPGAGSDVFRLLHLSALALLAQACKVHPDNAATGLLVLPLAAKAAAMLRLLAAAEGPLAPARLQLPVTPADLASSCHHLTAIFQKPVHIPAITSPDLLLQWGAAVHAGLGLLPLLQELRRRPQPAAAVPPVVDIAGEEGVAPSLANLAGGLIETWQASYCQLAARASSYTSSQQGRAALAAPAAGAVLRQAAKMLQRLHLLGCTMVHWAAASALPDLAPLDLVVASLAGMRWAAADLLAMLPREPGSTNRPLHAVNAAHLEALLAAAQLSPAAALPTNAAHWKQRLARELTDAVLGAPAELAASPPAAAALVGAVLAVVQDPGSSLSERSRALTGLTVAMAQSPRLATSCASGGTLAAVLGTLGGPLASSQSEALQLAQGFAGCLAKLTTCAEQAASTLGSGQPANAALRAELVGAAVAVGRLFDDAVMSQHIARTGAPAVRVLQYLSGVVLPQAQPLLAALEVYWSLPQKAAVARLELAHAVAARSCCAHLRCPNLEAAAVRERGKLCDVCRAVRYCSPACARAAWKARAGGHKHVCALLAGDAGGDAVPGA